jgi:hypothetical protein
MDSQNNNGNPEGDNMSLIVSQIELNPEDIIILQKFLHVIILMMIYFFNFCRNVWKNFSIYEFLIYFLKLQIFIVNNYYMSQKLFDFYNNLTHTA